jgi:hypothetical protein
LKANGQFWDSIKRGSFLKNGISSLLTTIDMEHQLNAFYQYLESPINPPPCDENSFQEHTGIIIPTELHTLGSTPPPPPHNLDATAALVVDEETVQVHSPNSLTEVQLAHPYQEWQFRGG